MPLAPSLTDPPLPSQLGVGVAIFCAATGAAVPATLAVVAAAVAATSAWPVLLARRRTRELKRQARRFAQERKAAELVLSLDLAADGETGEVAAPATPPVRSVADIFSATERVAIELDEAPAVAKHQEDTERALQARAAVALDEAPAVLARTQSL